MSRLWRHINGLLVVAAFIAFVPLDAYAVDDNRSGGEAAARPVLTLQHPNGITTVTWSADGKRLATAGAMSHSVFVWDAESGVLVREFTREGQWESLAFANESHFLVTSAARLLPGAPPPAISLWDLTTGQIAKQFPGPFPERPLRSNAARLLAISDRGDLLAFVGPRVAAEVQLFDVARWHSVGTLSLGGGSPTTLAFSPDGAVLAVGTINGRIALFDVRTRALINLIDAYGEFESGVKALAFSPDGKLIASGPTIPTASKRRSDGFYATVVPPDPIRIWNASDGTLDQSFSGDFGVVYSLSWSPEGKRLASASGDHLARLWDLNSSTSTTVAKFQGVAYGVAFSPDGRKLAAAGDNVAIISETNASR